MILQVQKPIFAESASLFVNTMSEYEDTVLLKKDHWVVDAKSLLGVLAVSLQPGQTVELDIQGTNEEAIKRSLIEKDLFKEA
ncbi:HPr family phosphocarrier protein [Pontibacillus sp. ALD_SL1]|uniref:HPr family phosphocarrier protein n=1 Tax=Pontibacillus sp. ALD_SL1 TaxID=2777185 RepID=UPI001A970433|nr:HPr family phosphocarrier protein [Pontibacillus sp. ALD_SL1]QSS98551.1 HPr family phosphocarrier protein [Pontibacillus sp. ALD_SL1]